MTLWQGCGAPKLKRFESAEGKYSVTSPINLEKQILPVPTPDGNLQMYAMIGEVKNRGFLASYIDLPKNDALTTQDRLNGAREGAISTWGALVEQNIKDDDRKIFNAMFLIPRRFVMQLIA